MIIIIGAGLAGLSLARTLQREGVAFRIFEQAAGNRFQGFGLSLHDHSIPALLEMLDTDEPTLRKMVAVDRVSGWLPPNLYDIVSGKVHDKKGAATLPSEKHRDFRSNRERLWRTIQGDLQIEYNHKLIGIQQHDDLVVAEFANGERVAGNLLIGADGVHSMVRRTLRPEIVTKDSHGILYNGTRKVAKDDFARDYAPYMDGLAVKIGFYDQMALGCSLYDLDPETGEVSISWVYSRRRRGDDDPLFVPYAKSKGVSSGPTPWDELESLPKLALPWTNIFNHEKLRQDKILRQTLINHLVPKEDLKTTFNDHNVILMGDAAHAWSNHAGTAGNAAIMDGVTLGKIIAKGQTATEFYDERYESWQQAMVFNTKIFEDMHRPIEEWRKEVATDVQAPALGVQIPTETVL